MRGGGGGLAAAALRLLLLVPLQLRSAAAAASAAQPAAGSQTLLLSSLDAELLQLGGGGEYDIVTAYEVDQNGHYISPAVAHHERRKRSLSAGGSDLLHLRLQGFGHDFQLDLKTSDFLVAPGFTIQTLGKGRTKSIQTYPAEDFCFYQGVLRLHKNSSVALSTCGGMSGLIRTQEADYFLKPLPPNLALKHGFSAPASGHSHVLYKRSTEPELSIGNEVLVNERQREAAAPSVSREPQHHPHSKHQRKLHFCGRRKKYMPQPPGGDTYILLDEYNYLLRNKRSLLKGYKNKELNVETLVVVDRKMLQNHGRDNITTYVLTILNMVSALFRDGTIGGNINIAVVGLILLEEDQPGLTISHHADHTLSSFCQWQTGLMGKDGSRHDHAILLTGLDICSWKNEPCDTLGFAPISGMCSKYRSCTINEDSGLGLAFTVAHESGHNFGMVHDGEGNICKKSEGNIMSPTLAGHNGVFSWSACSRQYLYKFLSSTQSLCLTDQPRSVQEYKYPEKLPGELYDAATQCKWQFGEKAKLCMMDFKKDICKALWCHRVGRKCETKFMPAAEGTMCGYDMWCRGGQCVKYGDEGPKPTHGHWSEWSRWSSCSRTCGGGISHRQRNCTNPRPSHGGKFCEGSPQMLKLCNNQKCPKNSIGFRAAQCAEFNNRLFRGWNYKWKPYTQVEDQDLCKLYCIAEGFDFFFSLSNKVKDGTPCAEDSHNVCIDGICEMVGCDYVLGSSAVEDACGVCRGDNSSCRIYTGQHTKYHSINQYYALVTIPAGARSIHVYEMNLSNSYIAVRSSSKKYHLNGYWTVDWPGRYKFAGTVFDYRRSHNHLEALSAPGPTNESVIIELLSQGKNPGIAWEYSLPKAENEKITTLKHNYTWAVTHSKCSVSCGGGQMVAKESCYKDQRVQVDTSLCDSKSRTATRIVPCKMPACPPSWSVGNWSECSLTCGGGERYRSVRCTQRIQYKPEWVSHSLCRSPAPVTRELCNTQNCPPTWSIGPWSECSRTCGKGWRKRVVLCKSSSSSFWPQILPDLACVVEPKPKMQEICLLKRCHKPKKLHWFVSAWSECSVTCGKGVQRRTLNCAEKSVSGKYREVAPKKCSHLQKPSMDWEKTCILNLCPGLPMYSPRSQSSWFASPWSQCTATCGGGTQVRSVQCLASGRSAMGCLLQQKPIASQACNTNFCPFPEAKDAFCRDYFNWCHLVPQHGVCNHSFYGKQCCRSCINSNL
ncbi:A disintegrin and metalloproteinase with thrombospondin motifs 16 [Heteronotia binoei]|uniref:A disintegrin and metalloproteinase with thrombospondin motifs 16 n=1 Tax=Heteronotia binoei TaxID=13085 RepID=UPI00292CE48D|nr:A disintegrin and metalloproteinase with thrombospondin motifs 16 [Heteronotia binoei]